MNLGAGLSMLGKSVLLVDLDPQAHLTYGLGIQAHELDYTVYEVLKGEISAAETIVERGKLEILPASLSLSAAEIELSGMAGREFLLKEALAELTPRDFVLLDCPPSLGLLTLNALTAAQEVFIPLQTEFLALQGMSKLMDTINVVRKRLNPGLTISGIIGTQFDSRKNLNKEVVDKIREYFSDKVFSTLIHDNVALAEAPSYGKTIFEYRPTCRGAQDYMDLCRETVARRQEPFRGVRRGRDGSKPGCVARKRAKGDAVPSDKLSDKAKRPDGAVPSGADGGPQGAVLSSLARQSSLPSVGRLAPRPRRHARDRALPSERL